MKIDNIQYKGISQTKNNKFEAYLHVKHNKASRSNNKFKAHIGSYNTLEEAVKARINFINSLK